MSKRRERLLSGQDWVMVLILLAIPLGEGYLLLRDRSQAAGGGPRAEAALSLAETLGGADTVGYARAVEPRAFEFPGDHGPHDDYRSEWWYFTGNLESSDARRFGFQFTIFRGALAPPSEPNVSHTPPSEPRVSLAPPSGSHVTVGPAEGWATRQVYLGHFTVTDVAGESFTEFERFTRGSTGLAGAAASPFRVWLDDWEVSGSGRADSVSARPPTWPMALTARDQGVALDLELTPVKPMVLQGVDGLSQKGPEPGNASYYYSFTRIGAEGVVEVDGETIPVSGTAWLDREWSTSALSEGVVGWDWFALQLSNGEDLMVYQLRREDGGADPRSDGVLVDPAGRPIHLSVDDFELRVDGRWESPIDGSIYPSGWTVRVPEQDLELSVTPVLKDQELDVSLRYWEGAVDVVGTSDGQSVSGRGYVELTGYAGAAASTRGGARR